MRPQTGASQWSWRRTSPTGSCGAVPGCGCLLHFGRFKRHTHLEFDLAFVSAPSAHPPVLQIEDGLARGVMDLSWKMRHSRSIRRLSMSAFVSERHPTATSTYAATLGVSVARAVHLGQSSGEKAQRASATLNRHTKIERRGAPCRATAKRTAGSSAAHLRSPG